MPEASLLGLVLAGGKSRRMGTDKGGIQYHGRSQRAHTAALLAPFCEAVYVSVRLEQLEKLEQGLTPLLDVHADIGPMAGLLAAFQAHPEAAWLVVACDLPFMTSEAIGRLAAARSPDWDAVAFKGTDGRPEPMAAVWEPSLATALQVAFVAGHHSLRDVMLAARCQLLPASNQTLLDVDSPKDFGAAQGHPLS